MILILSRENRIRILILLIGILLFIPFNGYVHLFDWDEINFAESAREMIVTGDYSTVKINFIPFWEKPPLFIWMQVLSMKIFGINEFAARFPNAVCGIITLLVLFELGSKLKDYKFGLFWAIAYGASVLPFLYFKSGIIDPWFNLFIFLSLYFGYKRLESCSSYPSRKIDLFLAGMTLGLAVLTKGPVAILLFGTAFLFFIVLERRFHQIRWFDLLFFILTLIIVGGAYHIYQFTIGNRQLITDFFEYQVRLLNTEDAGHGGSIIYHPVVLLIGVFPSSVLALPALFKRTGRKDFNLLMVILFWIVLVLFSLVKTKIVHYSSLCYFPISYLAATTLYRLSTGREQLKKSTKLILMLIGLIYALIPLVLKVVVSTELRPVLQEYIHDDFALACLGRFADWSNWELLPGLVLGLSLLISLFLKGLKKLFFVYASITAYVFLFLLIILPKIESYSQGPAIDFIKESKSNNVWISTLEYKSYAPYFYSEKAHRAIDIGDENKFLLESSSADSIYFIAKITSLERLLKTFPQLELVKKDGGYVLLKRIK